MNEPTHAGPATPPPPPIQHPHTTANRLPHHYPRIRGFPEQTLLKFKSQKPPQKGSKPKTLWRDPLGSSWGGGTGSLGHCSFWSPQKKGLTVWGLPDLGGGSTALGLFVFPCKNANQSTTSTQLTNQQNTQSWQVAGGESRDRQSGGPLLWRRRFGRGTLMALYGRSGHPGTKDNSVTAVFCSLCSGLLSDWGLSC